MPARFVVGIDLGTTNCAVSYAEREGGAIRSFAIPQLTGPGEVEARTTLPSFLLLPEPHEVAAAQLALPWAATGTFAVGAFARDRGAELPLRLVASAKSWLSYAGVDRSAPILPWRGQDEDASGARVSPIGAEARYLAHLRAAWDDAFADAPLAEQEVLVTVPASFDAVARELTVSACETAGLTEVTLLEEPQAAFYAYLAAAGDGWRQELVAGDVILVCDLGGGTSDFSLIAVADDGAGNLALERLAVGEHILLGGDNMDLALAHATGQKLAAAGKPVTGAQFRALVHACRRAKELLLGDDPPASVPIALLGGGSRLIGGTLRTEITRDEAHALLIDGFFPWVGADARPRAQRALGLRELGLPYASDPSVTAHLAAFVARHGKPPRRILHNGGVLKAAALRQRVAEVVASWAATPLVELGGTDLDLAVAHGAAYYGLVRHGRGIRIRGGTARAYYIGVESAMPAIPGFAPPVKALCVAPFGMEEGARVDVPGPPLGLAVGEATSFRFFASSVRRDDRPGTLVDADGAELTELSPVEADLPGDPGAGGVVAVSLSAAVTEVGTLELWAAERGGAGRWRLEYALRERG